LCPTCAAAEEAGVRNDHQQFPLEKYEQLFKAFCERQTISFAARAVGCDEGTAKRYIDGPADPARGLEPIRKRFQGAMRKAMRRVDYGLQRAMETSLELYKTAKLTLSKQLVRDNFQVDERGEVLRDAQGQPLMREDAVGVSDVYAAIARITQAEMAMLERMSGPGNRPPDLFDGWTREEIDIYARSGRWPERVVRLRLTHVRRDESDQ
jgi:hypothetical protein